jgi:DNA polymerase-3 subunit delta
MRKAASTELDLRRLQLALDKKGPQNIYLLHGEEVFLVDQALQAIKLKTLEPGMEDFNYDRFIAPENSPAQVFDAVEMLPMMSTRRLVIYRNVDALKDEAWEALAPALENPINSTTLVLVANKIDKRKKVFKKLIEVAEVVDLKKPFENQIPIWIDYIGYLQKVKISSDAQAALHQLVGSNLSDVNNEVEKLKIFIGGKNNIEIEDVLKVVSRARIENVFSLTDAIAKQNRTQALSCLANLLENGQNEVGIVSLIHRQIRILSSLNAGMRQGLTGFRLAQKVGVPEFFLKEYVAQSRHWDNGKINSTIQALHDTDLALKSSPVSSHIWLENFILKTC